MTILDLVEALEFAAEEGWRVVSDLGFTTFSYKWASREEEAAMAAIHGLKYGYPACCVEEFVSDIERGRHPALRRGWLPTETGGHYVPCSMCCEVIGREYIS